MKKYVTLIPIKFKRKTGEIITLEPGDTFAPTDDNALQELLKSGKVKPFCYWAEKPVIECIYPCFLINEMKVIKECNHFSKYWRERVKILEHK